jgi:hypothetical protein
MTPCTHRIVVIKREIRQHPLVLCVDCLEARPRNHGKKPHALQNLANLARHTARPIEETNFKQVFDK